MSRATWSLIKQSKRFYINTYRRIGTTLFVSLVLNVLTGGAIYYVYMNKSPHDFYATSGITPPVRLTAMAAPNYSSNALLANDQISDNNNKVIPQ